MNSCISFLNEIENERSFVIVSDIFVKDLVSVIHDLSKLDSIFILCEDDRQSQSWTLKWPKIKGIFNSIFSVFYILKQSARKY